MADDDWETDPDYTYQAPPKSASLVWSKCSFSNVPPDRHSTAITYINDNVFLFCGTKHAQAFDDVWKLDLKSWKWTLCETTGNKPSAIWGHSIGSIGKNIFLFAGQDIQGANCDLFVLNTDTMSWTRPVQSGPAPSPRSYHASCIHGNLMYVFGGAENDNSLYILNTATMEWTRPDLTGQVPDPTKEASLCYSENKLHLFGGIRLQTMEYLNDLYIIDLATCKCTKQVVTGAAMEHRAGHVAAIINNHLVVYGGRGGRTKGFFPEIYFADIKMPSWAKSKGSGQIPKPRANHCACIIPKDKLFIFGGLVDDKVTTNEGFILEI